MFWSGFMVTWSLVVGDEFVDNEQETALGPLQNIVDPTLCSVAKQQWIYLLLEMCEQEMFRYPV